MLPWQQNSRCHSSFVMYISGVKFEEHCPNISGDILDSVFHCLSGTIYDIITVLSSFAYRTNVNISKTNIDIQKGKHSSSLL